MIDEMNFDYNSLRARNARLGKVFGKPLMLVLFSLMLIGLLGGGIALLVLKMTIGWTLIGFAVLPLMLIIWTKKELITVPVSSKRGINGLLSNDVLAAMPKNPTVSDLASVVSKTNSGKFMYIRYGISGQLLTEVAKQLPPEVGPIFQTAIKIQEGTNSEEIHGAILAAAILANFKDSELLLKRMRLDMEDILDGVIWFNYLNGLVKNMNVRRHTGGIGRDLSFGYIPTLQRFGQNISIIKINLSIINFCIFR